MSLYQIGEVFGHAVEDDSTLARRNQAKRACPFRGGPCTKGNIKDPLGICSLTDGSRLATVCPVRFIEGGRVFKDVGRLAFGSGVKIIAAPEVRILRVTKLNDTGGRAHKIGKVDYLIARLDSQRKPVDFAALEVQAVYFSGASVRGAFQHFLKYRKLPPGSGRRPDWRSSAQKRLMPQLSLKIPVFRRWGKKFFVAVDSNFYGSLPAIRTIPSFANSEITWLVYPFARGTQGYAMGQAEARFSTWDEVVTSLREGEAPDPSEVIEEIQWKMESAHLAVLTT